MATLSAARTELWDIGGGVLSADTTTTDYYLNLAKNWLEDRDDWPWLETTATGSSPLTVSDLKRVLYVADTTNDVLLKPAEMIDIARRDPGVDNTGQPAFYYLDGLTSVKVWPTTSVNLSVRYIKYSPELTSSDTPLIPTRYHFLWVKIAFWLYAQAMQPSLVSQDLVQTIQSTVEDMRTQFMSRNPNAQANLYGSVYNWYGPE